MNSRIVGISAMLTLLAAGCPLTAQTNSASISGLVTDPSGSVVGVANVGDSDGN
jgi:hypothetical protein